MVVGSALLGQNFLDAKGQPLPQYFQPRPSDSPAPATTPRGSGASNLGPGDPRLVGFNPGLNTVGLDGSPSKTNPFATRADPFCVPTDRAGDPVTAPTAGQTVRQDQDRPVRVRPEHGARTGHRLPPTQRPGRLGQVPSMR